jgi:hypothetical protein
MRSRVALPLTVVLFSVLAVGAWLNSNELAWEWLLNAAPTAGIFGAAARDLPKETPAQKNERHRRDGVIRADLVWSMRVSRISAAGSLLGAVALVWRHRKDSRRHLFGAAGVGLMALFVSMLVYLV